MPQVFKIGSYWIYFWSNENDPIEPVHVHIAEGKPKANGTKLRCIYHIPKTGGKLKWEYMKN